MHLFDCSWDCLISCKDFSYTFGPKTYIVKTHCKTSLMISCCNVFIGGKATKNSHLILYARH